MPARSLRAVATGRTSFSFLRLSGIPVCCFLSTHVSVDSGDFRVSAIVNNAGVSMGVLTFLRDSDLIFSGNMPEVELLDLLATFFFLKKHHTMFHSGCPNLNPPPAVRTGSLFSASLSSLVISCLFPSSHSHRYEIVFHCGSRFPDG